METQTPESKFALSQLLTLIEDYHSFNPESTIPIVPYPTALQFSQQVAHARPCVYRLEWSTLAADANDNLGGVDGKPVPSRPSPDCDFSKLVAEQQLILSAPCFRWTKKTLCNLVNEKVEVAVTPDGRADSLCSLPKGRQQHREPGLNGQSRAGAVALDVASYVESAEGETEQQTEQVFIQPATVLMNLPELLDKLRSTGSTSTTDSPPDSKPSAPVYYLQSQNSNLSSPPLSQLLAHLPSAPPPFSLPVLCEPEATNIWIGSDQSVTSTHRDPYENLYLVVKGHKRFVLYAPCRGDMFARHDGPDRQVGFDEQTGASRS